MIKNTESIKIEEQNGYIYKVFVEVIYNCKCKNRKFTYEDINIIYKKNTNSLIGKNVICDKCKNKVAVILENPKNKYIKIENEIRLVEEINKCNCNNESIEIDKEKNIACFKCKKIIAKTKEIPFSLIGTTRSKNFLELSAEDYN